MVKSSRFFTNPQWTSGALIEWRLGEMKLYRHTKDGDVNIWKTPLAQYKNDQETLARCLRAVGRKTWIEVEGTFIIFKDIPETSITPW